MRDLYRLSLPREKPALDLAAAGPDRIDSTRPLVSVPLAAKELKVSPQAVESMLKELGTVRELTGRGRYRAWGIL